MAFDAHKNLAISTVVTAPSPGTSGTSLTVTASEGARFPAPPFNATVWPSTAMPTPANAEVVRVTARTTDTLTIARAQEGTTARAMAAGDLIAASITAKTLTDLETRAALKDEANVFTVGPQTLQGAPPALAFYDGAQPANLRRWELFSTNALYGRPTNDAGVAAINAITITQAGDIEAWRNLREKGRTTPLGHWAAEPFTAANFSGTAPLVWTVAPGSFGHSRYALIGTTLVWTLAINGAPLTGSAGGSLVAILPGGKITGSQSNAFAGSGFGHFGAWEPLMIETTAAVNYVKIYRNGAAAIPTGNLYVHFTITVETA